MSECLRAGQSCCFIHFLLTWIFPHPNFVLCQTDRSQTPPHISNCESASQIKKLSRFEVAVWTATAEKVWTKLFTHPPENLWCLYVKTAIDSSQKTLNFSNLYSCPQNHCADWVETSKILLAGVRGDPVELLIKQPALTSSSTDPADSVDTPVSIQVKTFFLFFH